MTNPPQPPFTKGGFILPFSKQGNQAPLSGESIQDSPFGKGG